MCGCNQLRKEPGDPSRAKAERKKFTHHCITSHQGAQAFNDSSREHGGWGGMGQAWTGLDRLDRCKVQLAALNKGLPSTVHTFWTVVYSCRVQQLYSNSVHSLQQDTPPFSLLGSFCLGTATPSSRTLASLPFCSTPFIFIRRFTDQSVTSH